MALTFFFSWLSILLLFGVRGGGVYWHVWLYTHTHLQCVRHLETRCRPPAMGTLCLCIPELTSWRRQCGRGVCGALESGLGLNTGFAIQSYDFWVPFIFEFTALCYFSLGTRAETLPCAAHSSCSVVFVEWMNEPEVSWRTAVLACAEHVMHHIPSSVISITSCVCCSPGLWTSRRHKCVFFADCQSWKKSWRLC